MPEVTGGIWIKWQLFSGFRTISYILEEIQDLSLSLENLQEESAFLLL